MTVQFIGESIFICDVSQKPANDSAVERWHTEIAMNTSLQTRKADENYWLNRINDSVIEGVDYRIVDDVAVSITNESSIALNNTVDKLKYVGVGISAKNTDPVQQSVMIAIPPDQAIKRYCQFTLSDDPEILHIIKSGFEDRYFYFWEDAYEQEPWKTGMKTGTKEQLERVFNIKLPW